MFSANVASLILGLTLRVFFADATEAFISGSEQDPRFEASSEGLIKVGAKRFISCLPKCEWVVSDLTKRLVRKFPRMTFGNWGSENSPIFEAWDSERLRTTFVLHRISFFATRRFGSKRLGWLGVLRGPVGSRKNGSSGF